LIYALNNVGRSEKGRIKKMIKRSAQEPKYVHDVIDFVKSSGGIQYATSVMEDFHEKAKKILNKLPDSVYKTSLDQLVQFTIDRTK